MADNKFQYIKDHVNIVDVISRVINLKKNGKDYIGKCCFHDEKTESFTVSENKQFFHCFGGGCKAHGDVYDFLINHHGYTMGQAAEYLTHEYSLIIPEHLKRGGQKKDENRSDLVKRIATYSLMCKQSAMGNEILKNTTISPALATLEIGVINDPDKIKSVVMHDPKLLESAKKCKLISGEKINLTQGIVFLQRNPNTEFKSIFTADGRLISTENITPLFTSKGRVNELHAFFSWNDFLHNADAQSCYVAKYFSDMSSTDLSKLTSQTEAVNFIIPQNEEIELMQHMISLYKDGLIISINEKSLLTMAASHIINRTQQDIAKAKSGFHLSDVLLTTYNKIKFGGNSLIAQTLLINHIANAFGVKADMLLSHMERKEEQSQKKENAEMQTAISVAKLNQLRSMF